MGFRRQEASAANPTFPALFVRRAILEMGGSNDPADFKQTVSNEVRGGTSATARYYGRR